MYNDNAQIQRQIRLKHSFRKQKGMETDNQSTQNEEPKTEGVIRPEFTQL